MPTVHAHNAAAAAAAAGVPPSRPANATKASFVDLPAEVQDRIWGHLRDQPTFEAMKNTHALGRTSKAHLHHFKMQHPGAYRNIKDAVREVMQGHAIGIITGNKQREGVYGDIFWDVKRTNPTTLSFAVHGNVAKRPVYHGVGIVATFDIVARDGAWHLDFRRVTVSARRARGAAANKAAEAATVDRYKRFVQNAVDAYNATPIASRSAREPAHMAARAMFG